MGKSALKTPESGKKVRKCAKAERILLHPAASKKSGAGGVFALRPGEKAEDEKVLRRVL